MIFKGLKRRKGLADELRYVASLKDGVLLLRDDSFLAAWALRGPDISAMDDADIWSLSHQVASAMKLGNGWTIQTDLMRSESHEGYPPRCAWMPLASQLIDEERRQRFSYTGDHAPFVSQYYLCLTYQPPKPKKSEKWLFDEETGEGQATRDLRYFESVCSEIDEALRAQLGRFRNTFVRRLGRRKTAGGSVYDDLCRYIRYCVRGEDFDFRIDYPLAISRYFADQFVNGSVPILGEKHISVISIDGFPSRTFAGIMGGVENLRFPFRYTQQGRCMDSHEAFQFHQKNLTFWSKSKRGIGDKLMNKQSTNDHADKMFLDAKDAGLEAQFGGKVSVVYSAKIILMDDDASRLNRHAKEVATVIRNLALDAEKCGFQTRRETLNVANAWFASLPGHAKEEVREGGMTVNNLVQMAPLSSPYTGEPHNPSEFLPPKTPPIVVAYTTGGSPYNLHLHVNSAGKGNVLIVGPAGSGKTTLLNLLISQWSRLHPEARVFSIDKDLTQYTLIRAMGGTYYDLTPGTDLGFCPLADIDSPQGMATSVYYLRLLCQLNGLELKPQMTNEIERVIQYMQASRGRSMTHFVTAIRPSCPQVADALKVYTSESAQSGGILDADFDALDYSRIAAAEVGKLYEIDPKVTSAVLFHLFGRVRKSLDPARPTLLAIDELSNSLDQPVAVKALGDFLISVRKMNMSMVMCIQDLNKVLLSDLANTAVRECENLIFLPNPAAMTQEKAVYEKFGCNGRDIEIIANAIPAREYYQITPGGRRLFDFSLGKAALTLLGKSKPVDRKLIDQLAERNPQTFVADFLRAYGVKDWPEYYESLVSEQDDHVQIEVLDNFHSAASVGD